MEGYEGDEYLWAGFVLYDFFFLRPFLRFYGFWEGDLWQTATGNGLNTQAMESSKTTGTLVAQR